MSSLTKKLMGTSGGETYWYAVDSGGGTENYSRLAFTPDGKIAVAGSTNLVTSGGTDVLLSVYTADGDLEWSTIFGWNLNINYGTVVNDTISGVAADSVGNIYVLWQAYYTNVYTDWNVVKFSPSGTLLWTKRIHTPKHDYSKQIVVNSQDEIILVGRQGDGSPLYSEIQIMKLSSDGASIWHKTLSQSSTDDLIGGVVLDASDNIYISGYAGKSGSSASTAFVAKYNTSGALQWISGISVSALSDRFECIAIDSSGNLIVGGLSIDLNDTSGAVGLLAKFNSSGTLLWSKTVLGATLGYSRSVNKVQVDSEDNIYASIGNPKTILKYDASGTLLFQTQSDSISFSQFSLDSNDNFYIPTTWTSADAYLVKLPSVDLSGTYGPFTFSAGSVASGTYTGVSASTGLSDTSLTMSNSSVTPTITPQTLSHSLTQLNL